VGLVHIEGFINSLNNSKNTFELCKQEKFFIDNNYSTIGSRKYIYSLYRHEVKKYCSNIIQKTVFNYFKLTENEICIYKKQYKEKVKIEQNNLKQIFDYKGYITKAEIFIDSNNFIDNVLGFASLTGRRVAEIGCTADFNLDIPGHLIFKGQLKTKDVVLYDAFVIPSLTNTISLYESFKKFRVSFPKYLNNPRKFHDNCSKDLNVRVKKHFSSFVEGDISPKDLRAIYATIACKLLKTNNKQTDQSYIADILGHSKDDLTTCNSYFDYVIL
jgi:integrase